MYEDPILYVGQLQPDSVLLEDESTSVFETPSKPTLLMRQLLFLAKQQRYVTVVLLTSERLLGKIVRLEDDKVLIETEHAKLWIAVDAIRTIK